MHCPSIQLFVDRAQAVRLGFELTAANGTAVAMLCARLEGLPLALELAAARAGVLTPEQMLAHLEHRLDFLVSRRRDAEPRHRTMRAALDWSYQLLLPDLRRFFARLSVFRGGFTLAAAEEVCEEPRALNRLEELHRCSLLLAEECGGEMRFRLLEILREYGREQLAPEEEATLVRRHGSFYLALAEQAVEEGFMGTNQVAWMSRLEQEHDNMRAALAAYLAADDLRMGLRLGAALAWFWGMAGYLTEGRENVAHLLELVDPYRTSDDPALAAVRSRALLMAVAMAYYQGDLAMSRQLGAESEALCRGLEDRFGLVGALGTQGMAAVAQGDLAAAQTYGEETLAIARADGGPFLVSWAHFALGNVLAERGDDLGARAQQEQVVRFARESGHDWALARGMSLGGYLALRQREFRSARARYEESLAMRRRLGDPVGTAWMLARLAHLARYEGELKRAASLLDESLTLARELRMRDLVAFVHYVRGRVALDEGRVDAAFDCFCESLVLRREGGEKPGMVQCLEGLAEEEEAQGRPGEAARFFGAAAAGRDALGMPLPPCDLPDVERHTASALEALGRSAFVAAWEAGRALSLEEAVAFALDESHEG